MKQELQTKYNNLLVILKKYKSVAVAFSSGVDSTLLLYAAKEALDQQAIAITAISASFPKRERIEAKAYCEDLGITHFQMKTNELDIEGFAKNPPNRCYICKKALFSQMLELAKKQGIEILVEGSNVDDDGDYRPGMQAIQELGVHSPLREAGLTKGEIRELSKEFDLPTWDKQSFACLSTRFPYGERITREKLAMIDEAEQFLLDMEFHQLRVRMHQDMARIELLPEEFSRFMQDEVRMKTYETFQKIGFRYVALDLKGYRTGSLNEIL